MQLFYLPQLPESGDLDPEESGHAVRVLRKRVGDEILATNGRGTRFRTQLVEASPKRCRVEVMEAIPAQKPQPWLHLVVAPTKNLDRTEWWVEKAVEIGVRSIAFITTEHSERKVLKLDRLERKVVSAMKQSLKDWLPAMQPLLSWKEWLADFDKNHPSYIAHLAGPETPHLFQTCQPHTETTVLIGPEGGFSDEEVAQAQDQGIAPVLLGSERLRTETAAVVAATTMALKNDLG